MLKLWAQTPHIQTHRPTEVAAIAPQKDIIKNLALCSPSSSLSSAQKLAGFHCTSTYQLNYK